MSKEVLNQNDLLEILPFKRTKLFELLRSKEIPTVKIGRDYIITRTALLTWIEENLGQEIIYK
jgi:excisionase family DNA binding protein